MRGGGRNAGRCDLAHQRHPDRGDREADRDHQEGIGVGLGLRFPSGERPELSHGDAEDLENAHREHGKPDLERAEPAAARAHAKKV